MIYLLEVSECVQLSCFEWFNLLCSLLETYAIHLYRLPNVPHFRITFSSPLGILLDKMYIVYQVVLLLLTSVSGKSL